MIGKNSHIDIAEDEAEIGYWIGVPFWGMGIIPEATQCLIDYAFNDLHLKKLWCGYFDGNEQSKRVQEKCGFHYCQRFKDKEWPLLNTTKTQHITCLSKDKWNDNHGK